MHNIAIGIEDVGSFAKKKVEQFVNHKPTIAESPGAVKSLDY